MDTRTAYALYTSAYITLGNITPIPADCGELCSAKCCGGDNDSGMILFPGEAELLSGAEFLSIEKRDMNGVQVDFAVCSGKCRRNLRPLSCRVFPLAPHWDGKALTIIPDPRARYICPLLQAQDCITDEFRQACLDTFSKLLENDEVSQMLLSYSQMLDEYVNFTGI